MYSMKIPQKKLFYTIYKIVNLVNGKFYIGRHGTDDLDDDYPGGGSLLPTVRKKYGEENLIKYTLFIFYTEKEMMDMEELLVDPKDPMNYNMCVGGYGGASDYINEKIRKTKLNNNRKWSEEDKQEMSRDAMTYWDKVRSGEITRKNIIIVNGVMKRVDITNEKTKEKIRQTKTGAKRKPWTKEDSENRKLYWDKVRSGEVVRKDIVVIDGVIKRSDSVNKKVSKTKLDNKHRWTAEEKREMSKQKADYWDKVRSGEIIRKNIVIVDGVMINASEKEKEDKLIIEHNKNIHKERARIRIAKKEEKLLMQAIGSPAFYKLKIAEQEANKNKITHF